MLDYETLLCEEHDGSDRWWFLSEASYGGRQEGCEEEVHGGIVATTDERSTPLGPPSTDICTGSEEGAHNLRDFERGLIESICTKFETSHAFKDKLVRLFLFLIALRDVPVVKANDNSVDNTYFFASYGLLCILVTVIVVMVTACIFSYWTSRMREITMSKQNSSSVQATSVLVGESFGAGDSVATIDPIAVGVQRRRVSLQALRTASIADLEDEQLIDEGEALGAWSDWYDNMFDELEHNIECWSPK